MHLPALPQPPTQRHPDGSLRPPHITCRGGPGTSKRNMMTEERSRGVPARRGSKLPIKTAAAATLRQRQLSLGNRRPGSAHSKSPRQVCSGASAVTFPPPLPPGIARDGKVTKPPRRGRLVVHEAVIKFLQSTPLTKANNYYSLRRNGKVIFPQGASENTQATVTSPRQPQDVLSPPDCNSGKKTPMTCTIFPARPLCPERFVEIDGM